ncbi:hypothetical protein [Streptomyces albidoflavus]|uniref:hypothetical protein n=1 Tax=Streptomyces albidoflavus TaxID=1886 RepID=UPI00340ABBAD
MADLTTDDLGVAPMPEIEVDTSGGGGDPFLGNCQQFTWPRAVHIGQLQAEVSEVMGEQVRLAIVLPVGEDGMDVEVGAARPLTVFVTPSSADLSALRRVMAAHRPDPYYGMTDDERQRAQLEEKVRSGADLSLAEIQQALRMLVG